MITREVLERTVHIRCTEYAAGFIFEGEESRYLVTAEHVVRDYREKSVDIRRNREWVPLQGLEPSFINTKLDVAMFRIRGTSPVKGTAPPFGSVGLALGQDVYMCGFPTVDDRPTPSSDFPLPHVRKGIVSAMWAPGIEPEGVWLVDALIESGYSGGPAVFVNGDNRRQVLGIVRRIKSTSDIYSVEDADMNEVEGLFYRRQSGIIEVVDLGYLERVGALK